ncbi:MAG: hypothetical protein QG623_351 [Patescibacteria group bacterium]|nr:hypothetical protein [Patescibacteria group bacterium]
MAEISKIETREPNRVAVATVCGVIALVTTFNEVTVPIIKDVVAAILLP